MTETDGNHAVDVEWSEFDHAPFIEEILHSSLLLCTWVVSSKLQRHQRVAYIEHIVENDSSMGLYLS